MRTNTPKSFKQEPNIPVDMNQKESEGQIAQDQAMLMESGRRQGIEKSRKIGKRVESNRKDLLTIRENELLENIKKSGSLKYAAEEIRVSYRRAARILANIRDKWEKAVNTHNRLIAMCKRDEPFRKLLSKPAPRKTPQIEQENSANQLD